MTTGATSSTNVIARRTSSISAVGHNTTRAAVTTSSSSISAQGTPPTPTASASQHTPSAPASSSSVDPQRAPPTKAPEQDPTTPKSTGQSHSGKAQSHLSAKRRNMTQDQGRPLQEEIAPSNKRKMADAKEETKSPKRTKRSKSKQPPPARRKASESEAEASDSEEQEEEEKTSAHNTFATGVENEVKKYDVDVSVKIPHANWLRFT